MTNDIQQTKEAIAKLREKEPMCRDCADDGRPLCPNRQLLCEIGHGSLIALAADHTLLQRKLDRAMASLQLCEAEYSIKEIEEMV